MGFAQEREVAEAALAASDDTHGADLPYPPVARRLREAREALKLGQDEVAALWGQQPSMYWDLELFDNEAFDVISVEELSKLAGVLKIPLMVLLFGEEPPQPLPATTYADVVQRLRVKALEGATTTEELAEKIGWELTTFFYDPSNLRKLPIFGLRWICREVDVDWASTLMNV